MEVDDAESSDEVQAPPKRLDKKKGKAKVVEEDDDELDLGTPNDEKLSRFEKKGQKLHAKLEKKKQVEANESEDDDELDLGSEEEDDDSEEQTKPKKSEKKQKAVEPSDEEDEDEMDLEPLPVPGNEQIESVSGTLRRLSCSFLLNLPINFSTF